MNPVQDRPLAAVPGQTHRHAACSAVSSPSCGGARPVLRSVCAQDQAAMGQYLTGLGADRRRLRFHGAVHPLSERLLSQMTRGDGGTLLALVAVLPFDDGDVIVGEACCARSAEGQTAEFAISVAQASQGSGLAQQLLDALLQAAAAAGIVHVVGEVFEHNGRMANFLKRSGFEACGTPEDGVQRWQITLAQPVPCTPHDHGLDRWAGMATRLFSWAGRLAGPVRTRGAPAFNGGRQGSPGAFSKA